MSGFITDYTRNALRDLIFRTAAGLQKPAALFIGFITITHGLWAASTTYAVGNTIVPSTQNGRIYKCTAITTGNSAAGEPTWPITDGGSVVDAGVTWTEQTVAMKAGTFAEPAGGSYARVQNDPLDANWTAPATGATDNAVLLQFPAPTADWGWVAGLFVSDAASAGNIVWMSGSAIARQVMQNDQAPQIAIGDNDWSFS